MYAQVLQAQLQSHLQVAIVEAVYLGNAASVRNVSHLKKLGITAILNMAGPWAIPKKPFVYLNKRV